MIGCFVPIDLTTPPASMRPLQGQGAEEAEGDTEEIAPPALDALESLWNSGYFVLLGWLPTPGYGMLPLVNHSAVPSTVTPSRIPHATHRSAAVREVERWILGYVVPESAHETDKTSVSPEPAPRDWPLPELLPSRLTGAEPVIEDGRPVPGLTVLDF